MLCSQSLTPHFSSAFPQHFLCNQTTTTTTDSSDHAASLLDLPRECVALILSFLSPRDLCTLSSVCRSLRLVADSDDAWQHRLPHCTTPPVASLDRQLSTKKHIYFHLLRSQVLPVMLSFSMGFLPSVSIAWIFLYMMMQISISLELEWK